MSAWLQGIDAGRVAESWDGLAPPVQAMVTREAWDAGVRQGRASFPGAVTVRTMTESAPIPAPPAHLRACSCA
jgi:hypothetical protein